MKRSVLVEKMWLASRTGAFILGALSVGIAPVVLACDMKKTSAKEQQAAVQGTPAQPAAGMKVYVDPQTGEVVEPPAQEPPQSELDAGAAATSTSSAGLVPEPSPVPGGGTLIHLQGRFQSPVVATQGSDGKVKIEHQAPDTTTGGKR
ncbi:MAG: hypothetical protein HYZ50_26760 [Deltaproteobacteria bacterium]|nr:hypothetical protein [Deltaproteobacteria bacterium]